MFGMSAQIDLYGCNKDKVKDAEFIKETFAQLIVDIDMKAYGEPLLVEFGNEERVKGFTYVQLIETSAITAHFVNATGAIYVDVFSCKNFYKHKIANYLEEKFEATRRETSLKYRE